MGRDLAAADPAGCSEQAQWLEPHSSAQPSKQAPPSGERRRITELLCALVSGSIETGWLYPSCRLVVRIRHQPVGA